MAATLLELTRRIGNMLGDVTPLRADVGGSTTQFIDTQTLTTNMEAPRNREILFTESAQPDPENQGVVRRVTNWDLEAGWVSFDALTQGIAIGDRAEMYNFRGKGWRVSEYHSAINQAIAEAYPLYKEPRDISAEEAWSAGDTSISLGQLRESNELTHVSGVGYTDTAGILRVVPYASRYGMAGWSWAGDGTRIVLRGNQYTSQISDDGTNLEIIGYRRPDEFILNFFPEEPQYTYINSEWLCNKAAAILCFSALDRDQGNAYRAQRFDQMAERHLSSIRTRLPSTTRAILGA